MKRRILMVLFAVGAIAGFGSTACRVRHAGKARRAAFEDRLAKACVEAARSTQLPAR